MRSIAFLAMLLSSTAFALPPVVPRIFCFVSGASISGKRLNGLPYVAPGVKFETKMSTQSGSVEASCSISPK